MRIFSLSFHLFQNKCSYLEEILIGENQNLFLVCCHPMKPDWFSLDDSLHVHFHTMKTNRMKMYSFFFYRRDSDSIESESLLLLYCVVTPSVFLLCTDICFFFFNDNCWHFCIFKICQQIVINWTTGTTTATTTCQINIFSPTYFH